MTDNFYVFCFINQCFTILQWNGYSVCGYAQYGWMLCKASLAGDEGVSLFCATNGILIIISVKRAKILSMCPVSLDCPWTLLWLICQRWLVQPLNATWHGVSFIQFWLCKIILSLNSSNVASLEPTIYSKTCSNVDGRLICSLITLLKSKFHSFANV